MASPNASRESQSRLRRGETLSGKPMASGHIEKHGQLQPTDASLTSEQLITKFGHNERLCQLHEKHRQLQLHHARERHRVPQEEVVLQL